MRVCTVVLVALAPALALAAPKRLPGDEHVPRLVADPGITSFYIQSHDTDYTLVANFLAVGGDKTGKLRMDARAHGTVHSAACEMSPVASGVSGNCRIEHGLTAVGNVDVDVVYSDAQSQTDYLVTTFHLDVRSWNGYDKTVIWGIVPDDLLAVAYVRSTSKPVDLTFEFWSTSRALDTDDDAGVSLRCSVGGKRLGDVDVMMSRPFFTGGEDVFTHLETPTLDHEFHFTPYAAHPKGFVFGPKPKSGGPGSFLIDHPGRWDCQLRRRGKTFREFLFTVDDKGMIAPSTMQNGKHPVPLPDGVVLIDMRIPKDNGLEERIRPDAMKKSIGFGQPWPDGAGVKEAQAAFPPAVGKPD